MFKNKLVTAVAVIAVSVSSVGSAFPYHCALDLDFDTIQNFMSDFIDQQRTHLREIRYRVANISNKLPLIGYTKYTENGQKYLKIIVRGIMKPEDAPKTMRKEENKLSIATDYSSFSVEQDKGTIKMRAHYDLDDTQRHGSINLQGKVKLKEVNDFEVTSQGNTATIALQLPLEEEQEPVIKTYAFQAEEAGCAKPAPGVPSSVEK